MQAISKACDVAMPRYTYKHKHRESTYWWNDDIAELRRICLVCRRKLTRTRRRGVDTSDNDEYKRAKRDLKDAIARSKKEKWIELCNEINNDPWGLGYKIVMKKLGSRGPAAQLSENTMNNIVEVLFPTHAMRTDEVETVAATVDVPPFTAEELIIAANTLKNKKAPGPDKIPAEVIKVIAYRRPQVLLNMYNACLRDGIFPEVWKKQRLVLINKGKGDPESPSSYRPLCMLDTTGKLLEKLLKPRLAAAVEAAGGLSARQYGFRAQRSTIGAIEEVVKAASRTQCGNHYSRPIVLLATLDVKNAFNSVRWVDVLDALEHRFQAPAYIVRMMRSYLKDRELIYETKTGQKRKQLTAGAAQGSILGPDLWNISYDELLTLEMPHDTFLVGYADDVAAVITARNTDEAQRKINQVMLRTQSWMKSHGLQLATHKTELLVFTRRQTPLEIEMRINGEIMRTQKVIKYLGIRFDCKMTYWAQIQHATEKAAKATASLSRLMANLSGPLPSKKRLLMAVCNAILLYGCEVWAKVLERDCRKNVMMSVQRTAALRIASAYRTVSGAAALIVAGVIPIDLLAIERRQIYKLKKSQSLTQQKAVEARENTIKMWQKRWEVETRGRWTARVIPRLEVWIERQHGEVTYYVTQLMTGHGYFRKYLYKVGKSADSRCIYRDTESDDSNHTFFVCQRWTNLRKGIEERIGILTADNIVSKMLDSKENWLLIAQYVEDILKAKKIDLEAHIE